MILNDSDVQIRFRSDKSPSIFEILQFFLLIIDLATSEKDSSLSIKSLVT